MWSVVDFGKWRGKGLTLPQILVKDPDWFFWAIEENVFSGPLASQAKKLDRRARGIKLPAPLATTDCIQYMFAPDGKFAGFNVIVQSQPPHVGSSSEMRRPVLNLSAPRAFKSYDKLGCRLLLQTFKYYWFGGKNFTKSKVEDFFDDPVNFVKP